MSFEILPQLLVNALISGSIYALVSAGLSLSYGLLKILNFAHGHLMMVGAYMFFYFHIQSSHSLLVSGVLTALVMSLVAVLSLRFFVLPFTKYNYVLSFVSTLALGIILESCISMMFGVNVKSLSTGVMFDSIEIWGIYITPIQILIIISSVVLLSLLAALIHCTSYGRRVRALSFHEFGAQSLGISSRKTYYLIFVLATLIASYAGILVGYETNIQPTMGNAYTIKAFAAMTLGGLGNIWGTVAGSYILGLVENLSIGLDFWGYSVPAGYKDAFAFVIILLVLLVRPAGLFQAKMRKA